MFKRILYISLLLSLPGFFAASSNAGSISGQVTGPDGSTPLPGIDIIVYEQSDDERKLSPSAQTDALGNYTVSNLVAGTYRIEFRDPADDYLAEFYDNVPAYSYDFFRLWRATGIDVGPSEAVSDIDASLSLAGRIEGRVVGPDGLTPIAGINVQARQLAFSTQPFWAPTRGSAVTGADGNYVMKGLEEGSFRLLFSDPSGAYAQTAWTSSATVESGSDIPMEAGATVSDIDVVMAPGAAISGTVRYQGDASPIEGIQVIAWIWDAERWVWASDRHTDASGAYMMNGLPAGQYRVQFASSDQTYAAHYYDGASTRNSANDVILSIGQSEPGIDATLALASGISGTVTGPDGVTPLGFIYVQVYQWDTIHSLWEPIRGVLFNRPDGAYMIGGLAAGTYRLGFWDASPFGIHYEPRFFQDATDLSSGADVFVAAETTVTGIDVSLKPAARISCVITGPGGILLEFGSIRATAYRWDDSGQGWQPATQSGRWTLDGRYAIQDLAAGTYRVMFVDDDGEYLAQVYDGASDLDSGTDIEMVEGAQITIEVELALASSIPPHFITGIRGASQDEIEISYRGALGMEYGLQALLTHTGSWHQVGSSGLAVGSTNTFRHTVPGPAAWWRVIRLR